MYAVIKTGGKQYRVSAGDKIKVEQIAADVGQELVIDQVLAVANGGDISVGTPLVSGASVKATVVEHGLHDKIRIFKMRRRKHYQKRQGHRQAYTALFIAEIASSLGTATAVNTLAAQGESSPASAGVAGKGSTASTSKAGARKTVSKSAGGDDLAKIEGIGPKIGELLVAEGVTTFAKLAATSVETLKAILEKAGSRYAVHNPSTWPEQAALAAKGDWEGFKKLTNELSGGKRA